MAPGAWRSAIGAGAVGDTLAHPDRRRGTGRLERNVHHPVAKPRVPMKHSPATSRRPDRSGVFAFRPTTT